MLFAASLATSNLPPSPGLPLQVWGASPGQESCRCGANAQGEDGGGEEEEGGAGEDEEEQGGGRG